MTEQQRIEELLKPRFKVIALWPNTEYKVGDILAPDYYIEKTIKWCESFPHLFRKMEWWEDRSAEQMEAVKYAVLIKRPSYWIIGDILRLEEVAYKKKLIDYESHWNFKLRGDTQWRNATEIMPCTKVEYDKWIKDGKPRREITQYINSKPQP